MGRMRSNRTLQELGHSNDKVLHFTALRCRHHHADQEHCEGKVRDIKGTVINLPVCVTVMHFIVCLAPVVVG